MNINCYICGEPTKSRNRIALSNRMVICQKCFANNNGFVCKYCRCTYVGEQFNQKYHCCIYCFQGIKKQKEINKLRFHNYFFKPYPTFYPKKVNNQLYIGVELQVGGVKNYNKVNKFAAYNENNFIYIKKDSTIPKYGCQIVSYPATIDYHLSDKSQWKKILKNAKKYGLRSFDIDNCGLHFHVNRQFFSQNEIKNLDYFINTNKCDLIKISKRQSQFSRFLNKPIDLYGKPINRNRHCCLNLCNENTIQFRCFKGTLNYKSFMAYVEFIFFVCMYIKQTKNINQLNFSNFLQYIKNKKTKYLNNFIQKIGL